MSESNDSKPKRTAGSPAVVIEPATTARKIVPAVAVSRPVHRSSKTASEHVLATYCSALILVGESQQAVARGLTTLAIEMTELAQTTLTEAGDNAAALMRAGNFVDAIKVQFGYIRRSVASMVGASTRISEIGANLMTEASRPIVAPPSGAARLG